VLDNDGPAIKKANKKQVEADIRKVILQIGKKQGQQQDNKATSATSGRYGTETTSGELIVMNFYFTYNENFPSMGYILFCIY
jgi:hypothetical protein